MEENAIKKTANRILAVLLALVSTFGMIGTAFAAPRIGQQDTGTITVTGAEAGLTVSAYKLMDVTYDYTVDQPIDPVYFWVEEVREWMQANHDTYIAADGSVTETFSKLNTEDVAAFYDELAAAIKTGSLTLPVAGTAETGADGSATITGLPMANYLVLMEDGVNVYRPSAVNIIPKFDEATNQWVMTDATVTLKFTTPTIEKVADKPSVSIGDPINFTLTATVPTYPENAVSKNFAIGDKLSDGLTLDAGSIVIYGVAADGNRTQLTAGDEYTLTTANATRPSDGATAVDFLATFDYAKISGYSTIVVEYTAVLNENAVVDGDGNKNTAYLDYSNNPYEEDSWYPDDETVVKTFDITVNKVDKSAPTTMLSGAEFVLSTSESEDNALFFVKTGDGIYRKATADDTNTQTQTLVVGAADDRTGVLDIDGLAAGTYYLIETKAPGGYNKLKEPVVITIGEDGVVTVAGEAAEPVVVENGKGFELPTTGGMGTLLFTAGGVVLLGGGVILLTTLRRKRAEEK